MAAELKADFAVDATLFAEGKGIFDVMIDDKLVYSKYQTHRFPTKGEVTALIRKVTA